VFYREGGLRPDGKNPGNVWQVATAARGHGVSALSRTDKGPVVRGTVELKGKGAMRTHFPGGRAICRCHDRHPA